MLRQWHDVNADRAAAGRDELMARLSEARQRERHAQPAQPAKFAFGESIATVVAFTRSVIMNRYSPAVASLMFLVVIFALLMPSPQGPAYADQIMVPEGGRLEALDEEGNTLGPCPLQHTDVDVRISGFFSRVNVTQTYHNPYEKKIEAVYTFPLSHRAAVDRMTMTIGDRVVEGEVKERQLARQIYEAAREKGHVASLLEQERPNIFTQSVANIEPGAEVVVEISYVEVLQSRDKVYRFDFPMVVGPRYVPGAPTASPAVVPAELEARHGLVLLGPATLTVGAAGDLATLGSLQTGKLDALITAARPIKYPGDTWWGRGSATGGAGQPVLWYRFEAKYCDGSGELGELYTDGTGWLNGRWFYTDPKVIEGMGTGFAQNTSDVPDASRITPEPARPGTRAGHDIGVSVTIDTGGPGLVDIASELHEIERIDDAKRADGTPSRTTVVLAAKNEIPNRDFVLSWRQTADAIEEATFVHTSRADLGDYAGGFFTLILQPPDRVADVDVAPRELLFVMDTSGSMRGFPLEKSKEVMTRAIDAMRPGDTFNVITFAGRTAVLWDEPRPATPENRAAAKRLVEGQQGGGGTEMMKAINAALVQTAAGPQVLSPRQLVNLPADDRQVTLAAPYGTFHSTREAGVYRIPVEGELSLLLRLGGDLMPILQPQGVTVHVRGRWRTEDGRRVLAADDVSYAGRDAVTRPMRIVLFLTDGYVGNDVAIIDAVRTNAHTTRVFSFGIGNSVNRYLMEGMARAGRGEAEFVLLNTEADQAVERFTKRVETPVLTDISLDFSEGLRVVDLLPSPDAIPDLFDAKPLVIHGRYTGPGRGTLTIRGRTGAGAYERTIELDLPENEPDHDVTATLWARAKVDEILTPHLKAVQQGSPPADIQAEVVELGETFQIMTQYTSFVAVEKSRLTIGGRPVLVAVPIELPQGVSHEGVFGDAGGDDNLVTLGRQVQTLGFQARIENAGAMSSVGQTASVTPPPGRPQLKLVDGSRSNAAAAPPAAEPDVRRKSGKRTPPGARVGGGGGGPGTGRDAQRLDVRRREAGLQVVETNGELAKQTAGGTITLPWQQGMSDAQERGDAMAPADAKKEAELDELRRVLDAPAEEGRYHDRFLASEDADAAAIPGDLPAINEIVEDPDDAVPYLGDRMLFAESYALEIAAGVERGEVVQAGRLAEALVTARPDYEVGVKMRDALTDESLDVAERDARIAEQAVVARGELAVALEVLQRRVTARRVIDPALLALTGKRDAKDVETPMVTVLVERIDDRTIKALTAAGLAIEATAKSLPLIVGTVAPADLEAVALVEGVKRIERTRMRAL